MTFVAKKKTINQINDSQSAAAWEQVRGLEKFGYHEVSALTRITVTKASKIVRHWDACGVLDQIRPVGSKRQRSLWRIKPGAERPPAPKLRTPEDNMWTSMRHLGVFTPTDIAAHSATEAVIVTGETASIYSRALLSAGYLRVVSKATPGVREARYRLIKNTGPSAPRIRRVRALVDMNTEAVMMLSEVTQ